MSADTYKNIPSASTKNKLFKPPNNLNPYANNEYNNFDNQSRKVSAEKGVERGYKYSVGEMARSRDIAEQQYQPYSQPNPQSQKSQLTKLKRQLKQTQTKRIQITKQCSQLSSKYQKLEQQNQQLHRKIKQLQQLQQGEKFQYDELKFLNRQLTAEIEQLQTENRGLGEKLRYQTEVIERKYEEMENGTYKRIQQALKRLKKAIHYFTTLSIKEMEKTKQIQIENLNKTVEILRGKTRTDVANEKYEQQIQQLMNPIRNIQQQLHQVTKQLQSQKSQNQVLQLQLKKHKKLQKQLLPHYKTTIQNLKQNLAQLRMQLSQTEYTKLQVKNKYEQKYKEMEIKYEQMFKELRKVKLENRIYEKRIEEMEEDGEEEKGRLIGENQMLRKLYKADGEQKEVTGQDGHSFEDQHDMYQVDPDRQHKIETLSHKTKQKERKFQLKNDRGANLLTNTNLNVGNYLKKNYSASQLKISRQKQPHQKQRQRQKYSKQRQRQRQRGLNNKQTIQTQKNQNLGSDYYQLKQKADRNSKYQYHKNPATLSLSRQKQKHPQILPQIQNQAQQHIKKPKNYNHLRHTQNKATQQYKNLNHSQRQQTNNQQQMPYDENDNQLDQQLHSSYNHVSRSQEREKDMGALNSHGDDNQNDYVDDSQDHSINEVSHDGLKNQIFKIDQEIIQIQKTLDRELNMYK